MKLLECPLTAVLQAASVQDPVVVFARVTRGGLPVLGAAATALLQLPGEAGVVMEIQLRDDGLGKCSHITHCLSLLELEMRVAKISQS